MGFLTACLPATTYTEKNLKLFLYKKTGTIFTENI